MSSYDNVRQDVVRTVCTSDSRVTALTGRWGVGKSYILGRIYQDHDCEVVFENAIYSSLFGVKSISELKDKIAFLYSEGMIGKYPKAKEFSKSRIAVASAVLVGAVAKQFLGPVISNVVGIGLPKILANRLVILEDIERKDDSLCIKDLLAFVNEFSELHECRFLLIMNEFELTDRNSWKAYFEKVVDRKIVLNPTQEELAGIAVGDYSGIHISAARQAMVRVGVGSLRVINKLYKLIDDIFASSFIDGDSFVDETIFSAILLGAIYYRGLPGEYDFDGLVKNFDEKDFDLPNSLSNIFGITVGANECNNVVVKVASQYLDSGILDSTKLSAEVNRLRYEQSESDIDFSVRRLISQCKSKAINTEDDVARFFDGVEITPNTSSSGLVSFICKILKDNGFAKYGELLIDNWVEHYNENSEISFRQFMFDDEDYSRVHEKIASAKREKINFESRKYSLPGALARVSREIDFTKDDENRIFSANPREYLWELTSHLTGDELEEFIECNLKNGGGNVSEVRSFSYVHFLEACEIIKNLPIGQDERGLGAILSKRLSDFHLDGDQVVS